MIYDAKALVKRLLDNDIKAEQAKREADSSFRQKAEEIGKLGIWRE